MPHDLVELLDGAPFGHAGVDVEHLLLGFAEVAVTPRRGVEQVERRPENLVDGRAVFGYEPALHDAVVPFGAPRERFPAFRFDLVGQQERRDAEAPDQGHDENPAVAASPGDEASVEP